MVTATRFSEDLHHCQTFFLYRPHAAKGRVELSKQWTPVPPAVRAQVADTQTKLYDDLGARLTDEDLATCAMARSCARAGGTKVDLKLGHLHVARLKNGVASTHPLRGPELRALRRLQRDYPAAPYVFTTERGGPLTNSGVRKIVARAGEAAIGLARDVRGGLGDPRSHRCPCRSLGRVVKNSAKALASEMAIPPFCTVAVAVEDEPPARRRTLSGLLVRNAI